MPASKKSSSRSKKAAARPPRPAETVSEKIACRAVEIILSALEEGDRRTAFWVLEHHPRSPFRKDFVPEPEGEISVSFGRGFPASGEDDDAGPSA